ncbi:SDR family oxidoreductase [Novosphingobium sp. P6W]|uniref:SDR family NAD(P)-dependent oxidoreductase n=1 Tax=Novosphingobium sp. P6W TaxID=1609758 RepID=UPI0005C2E99C|nr:SDR family oxidoreductase [Novosphingobium sp. P6W]AXB80394.1 SDR family NAD(P)-dependent oxidoreductase [Novosphingobium sp. P6W]KIS31326.1 AraC family transcriptional regulator [Novosphingobium sp. P6W]
MTLMGTALVTGASTGIGAIYADRLAHRGYDLILVARNTERLQEVAARITDQTGRSVNVMTADLSDKEDLFTVERVLRENAGVTMLVNNAGFGGVTPLLKSDVGRMELMVDLNVTALMRLSYAAAPGFAARGGGTIINISSIVAIGPEILNGVYGGTKAFVLAFTQSLQHELADKGVRVQAVLPGGTATEFWGIAGAGGYADSPLVMPADAMVDAALAGLDLGEVVTIPPLQDGTLWDDYETQRQRIARDLAHATPGARYLAARV